LFFSLTVAKARYDRRALLRIEIAINDTSIDPVIEFN
jgi:hypothetical protein